MDKAKRADKIATAVLYIVSGLIVAILAFLLLYILIRGLPHVSWEFLTSPSKAYSTIQLCLSPIDYDDYQLTNFSWSRDLSI